MTPPALLTYQDVAARWTCSVRTVKRMVARRRLAKVVMGHRTVRFRLTAVEKAEEELTEEAA